MLSRFVKPLILVLAAFYAGSALAFFDVEVTAGKRWYKIDDGNNSGVASQEFDVAAHLDPIPLVPVAFGASVAVANLNKDDLGHASTATGFQGGLDVMAWIPFVPVVTPFARISVPLVGNWAIENTSGGSKSVETAKISGFRLNLGVKYPVLPVLKLLFEVGRGMEKFKVDSLKVDGVKVAGADKTYDLKSNTVMLGVEMGI